MKKIVFIVFLLLLLIGCKTRHAVIQVPLKTVERKVSTLVPIYIPGDSALLRAVFECDSLNNVLLKGISEQKGGNVGSTIGFKDGVMDYKADFKPDTVYLPSDTIYTEKEVPVIIEVPKVEYRLTGIQSVFFYIGLLATGVFAGWLISKFTNINFLKLK
ncbi:MAG: hypothetical protein VB068_14065 [Petrimonas sp.]|nr:hypothetical protein [Petrimonas sp.]MEA5061860.1 hypothetical protein [Petrimonas sp.]